MDTTSTAGFTPAFRVLKNDVDITANLADRLLALQIVSVSGGGNSSDMLTITLDDRDAAIEAPATDGPQAAELRILLGYRETGLVDMGSFRITTTTYGIMPRTMTLIGTGVDMTSDVKAPIISAYENTTLGEIADTIAKAAGVRAAVSSGLAGKAIAYLNQNESSMALIAGLARDYDANLKFGNGTMAVTERGSGLSASGQELAVINLSLEDIASGSSITETSRTSYGHVKASWFDTYTNERTWLRSTKSGINPDAPPFTVTTMSPTKDEAQARADAEMAAQTRSTKTGTLVLIKGRPDIKGGTPVNLQGWREGADDGYHCETATHSLTKDGGLLDFAAGLDGRLRHQHEQRDRADWAGLYASRVHQPEQVQSSWNRTCVIVPKLASRTAISCRWR